MFDLIFDDEVGSFGSDVKENMGQATAFRDKLLQTEEGKKVVDANAKRWAGFVGDTRKKLLGEIWSFISKNMSYDDNQVLYETFMGETSPGELESFRKQKEQKKIDYHRGLDERKYGREKWKMDQGLLDPKAQKSFKNLEDKLKKEGVDVSGIAPIEPTDKEKKGKVQLEGEDQSQVAARVAARWLLSSTG